MKIKLLRSTRKEYLIVRLKEVSVFCARTGESESERRLILNTLLDSKIALAAKSHKTGSLTQLKVVQQETKQRTPVFRNRTEVATTDNSTEKSENRSTWSGQKMGSDNRFH